MDVESLKTLLSADGLFSRSLPYFEFRQQQIDMLEHVVTAYQEGKIALIEAGTGTGKSIAYLLPAITQALKSQERTVISTNTIALQEQLIYKDIPQLLQILDVDIKAVLVKGMGNYLCLRKLSEARDETSIFQETTSVKIEQIEAWSKKTNTGCRSDLPFSLPTTVWPQLNAESDACSYKQCPFYEPCFFFKARKQAQQAQLLVVNHHLLFADIMMKSDPSSEESSAPRGILPEYRHVILDEAHNIEDIATEYFATRISRQQLYYSLKKLVTENRRTLSGKLIKLQERILKYQGKGKEKILELLKSKLTLSLPSQHAEVMRELNRLFSELDLFLNQYESSNPSNDLQLIKLRLRQSHLDSSSWKEGVIPQMHQTVESLKSYLDEIRSLESDMGQLNDEEWTSKQKSLLLDINSLVSRIDTMRQDLHNLIHQDERADSVKWLESNLGKANFHFDLVQADLDISKMLVESLFDPLSTVILCSATLTTHQNFKFIRKRLGLTEKIPEERIIEGIFSSPFDFKKQVLFAVPKEIPDPTSSQFVDSINPLILKAMQACSAHAFILFTSYQMLQKSFDVLAPKLKKMGYFPLKQGQMSRKQLITLFKKQKNPILFGTDSFWEGIDIAGDTLRCVILVKLPFRVPSEPITQARIEQIEKQGKRAFIDYILPTAIMQFKQGFGRLIRHKKDYGCVICLDPRLITKSYGKLFLKSLPQCQILSLEPAQLFEEINLFYSRFRHAKT